VSNAQRSKSHRRRILAAALAAVELSPEYDTWLSRSDPTDINNTDEYAYLRSMGSGYAKYPLIYFDLSSLVGCTIIGATLQYACHDIGNGNQGVYIHRILDANEWVASEANWNERKSGVAWAGGAVGCSTAGTDYDSTPCCADAVPVNDVLGEIHTVTFDANGIADLQYMVDTCNRGFVLKASSTAYNGAVCSVDHPTAAWRPVLEVTYV
jgi:hypothetical protein